MNTKNHLRSCRRMLALLVLLPLAARASETVMDPAGEPQTYVLFTGTDIRVLYNGKLHPVRDVDGNSLVIRFTDTSKSVDLPLASTAKKLVVSRVQTLSARSANVAGFKFERAYTPANDPRQKGLDAMQNAAKLLSHAGDLEDQVRREPPKIKVYKGGMGPEEIDNPNYAPLLERSELARNVSSGSLGSAGHQAGKMAEELARELFDALEVQFELTSDTPLRAAYLIVVAQYHTQDRPEDSESWVLAKSLGAIGSSPRKVWFREGGLPPGYVLEKVRLHLYEDGVEIATDLSENRASLTRDEAHEYLVIDHTSTHKAATMPAQLVLAKVPADWATRPKDESFHKTHFVKVDKTGHPVGTFEDAACTTVATNPYCDAVLRDQLFLPALEKGHPVDSVVRIKLARLSHQ
jgi:hypothetical protein